MRALLLCSLMLPFTAFAQTTHFVQVIGTPGGATPAYVPANITIDMGDQVEWVCNQGSHNVYAELDSFPNNPAPFNSAPTAQTSPWTYDFTFAIPGFYNYGCNGGTAQMPHWATQQGTVMVVDPSGIEEIAGWGRVAVFPMPANGVLYVEAANNVIARCELLSTDGRVLKIQTGNGPSMTIALDSLDAGPYLVRISDRAGRILVRHFVKE